MTILPPAGWYPTTPTDPYVRYWTGQRWSDHSVKAGTPLPPPDPGARLAAGVPRPWGVRVAVTVVAVLAVLAATRLAADLILSLVAAPAQAAASDWVTLSLVALVVWVPATKVGYRRRDIALLLIPFFSLFLMCRILWRCAYLPFADWLPRPEDVTNWRQVPHPTQPGELLYAPAHRDR